MGTPYIVKHGEGDKIVTYERKGECRHCGECCSLSCPQFSWIALRDIAKDELIVAGVDKGMIRSLCNIFTKSDLEKGCNPDVRIEFPSSPFSTPTNCGFTWTIIDVS